MKTAMQELIDYIESNEIVYNKDLILKLKELLEKEKEQIMNAYSDGAKGGANGIKGQHKNGWVSINTKEKYYKLLQQTSK